MSSLINLSSMQNYATQTLNNNTISFASNSNIRSIFSMSSMPDYDNAIDLKDLLSSTVSYTAPSDGYIYIYITKGVSSKQVHCGIVITTKKNNSIVFENRENYSDNDRFLTMMVPICEGDSAILKPVFKTDIPISEFIKKFIPVKE